jgi:hypothetical protein
MACVPLLQLLGPALLAASAPHPRGEIDKDPVTVTIKEVDLEQAIREFQEFQNRLDQYREEVSEGQRSAEEIAGILADLRENAGPENDYNEAAVLGVLEDYVESVMAKRVELIDFLESQRFRIAYYANKMAASVKPEDVALLFGTREQNAGAIRSLSVQVGDVEREIADFLDSLPESEFDRETFHPLPGIRPENQRRLAELEYRYQNARAALDVAKSRLRLVEEAGRTAAASSGHPELNVDLMLGQMFGALDRIRLQMSADLLYFESYLSNYERSARAHDVFQAFQQLISIQGGIEGPSKGLANVLDWLQESSYRQLGPSLDGLGMDQTFPRSSDLLREAYGRGRGIAD